MRIAVIADIHSNLHAFWAVKEEVERADHDAILCAGDIVGYGAYPSECCSEAQQMQVHAVLGNHDLAALTDDVSSMNPYAAAAARWTATRLSKEARTYLVSLRTEKTLQYGDLTIAMFHGSPRSVEEYVYEELVTESLLKASDCEVLILGHTHVPFVKRFKKGLVINPGSVGQPRDGDPRASFAVLDTASMTCAIHRVGYGIDKAAAAIRAAGLPDFLADRLSVGR